MGEVEMVMRRHLIVDIVRTYVYIACRVPKYQEFYQKQYLLWTNINDDNND